jgi:hypothetical protein
MRRRSLCRARPMPCLVALCAGGHISARALLLLGEQGAHRRARRPQGGRWRDGPSESLAAAAAAAALGCARCVTQAFGLFVVGVDQPRRLVRPRSAARRDCGIRAPCEREVSAHSIAALSGSLRAILQSYSGSPSAWTLPLALHASSACRGCASLDALCAVPLACCATQHCAARTARSTCP